jgi:transposase InsO family protein
MIVRLRQDYPQCSVRRLCRLLAVAPSSYYYRKEAADDRELRDQIERVALEFPRYGYRRMTVELRRRGSIVNHKRVLRLMWEEHLLVQVRRFCRTTNSVHDYGRFPNLLRGLRIARLNQVWCADITYVRLRRDFVYLAVIMDIYPRAIRGWELSGNLTEALTAAALERALAQQTPEIHHSDQGVQYAATDYVDRLLRRGIKVSMAARGQPRQNAFAERLMRTLKEEEVYLHEYADLTEARTRIGRFLDDVYMTKRIHSALGYQTPAEFEAAVVASGAHPVQL